MNVLSLFDGMSCGQQALERQGIKVDKYFASEIDKHAIKVTMANYPNTVQLGSVVNVDGRTLSKIDLLIGGSPCQSFSFAGKRKGMSTKDEQEILTLDHYLQLKSEGFEFEGQSYLFWEYMRLLNELREKNANVLFLLENVMMGEKWEKVLSKAIGVNPIMINSSLVSAQNRQRLYWTNIGMKPSGLFGDLESTIEQPKDKGILLKDILQDNQNSKYYVSNKLIDRINRSNNGKKCFSLNEKSICLASGYYKQGRDNQYIPVEEKYYLSEKMINGFLQHNKKHIEEKNQTGFNWKPTDGNKKANCLRANAALCPTDNTIIVKEKQVVQLNPSKESGGRQPYQQNRVYDLLGIAPALCANKSDLIINTPIYRRLTPIECERLQTVKDNYTNHVSDSQRYKMLGNGWTVDVIAHIFSYIV